MAEWYDNITDMRGYNNMTGTQAWPEYNKNLFSNTGIGRFDPRNMIRPDNLTQDMGANNYVAPPLQLNTLDPNWQHQLQMQKLPPRGNIDNSWMSNLKNKFSGITTPMLAFLQSQRNTPEENFGLDYYSGSLKDGRVNRNPAFNLHGDMNVASGFGAGLGAAGQKRIDKIKETIANLPEQWSNLATGTEEEQAQYAAKLAAHKEKLRQFTIQNQRYKTALAGKGGPEEIKEKITETITPKIIHHQGDGNKGGGGYQDQGGYSTQGGFTGKADPASGGVRGHHGDWADGGRIGYRDGEFVDEDINIQGPGFDVNENIEMAEGPSPFEMRIQELIDEGLSWQEAYTIAANEFGMAEGGDELVSEEGIASLV